MNSLAYCQYFTSNAGAAIDTLQHVLDEAEQLKHVSLLRFTLLNFILVRGPDGDADRAERQLARAQQLLGGIDGPADAEPPARAHRRRSRRLRGDLALALREMRSAIAFFEANRGGLPDFWPWFVLSHLLWQIGDREAAASVYEELPRSPRLARRGAAAVRFFSAALAASARPGRGRTARRAVTSRPRTSSSRRGICDFVRPLALHAARPRRRGPGPGSKRRADWLRKPSFVTRIEAASPCSSTLRAALARPSTLNAGAGRSRLAPGPAPPLAALRLRRSMAAAVARSRRHAACGRAGCRGVASRAPPRSRPGRRARAAGAVSAPNSCHARAAERAVRPAPAGPPGQKPQRSDAAPLAAHFATRLQRPGAYGAAMSAHEPPLPSRRTATGCDSNWSSTPRSADCGRWRAELRDAAGGRRSFATPLELIRHLARLGLTPASRGGLR
jgi:hypothetical protein